MIISVDAEKASDKIQHAFVIKTLHKVGIEGTYCNIINAIYQRSAATFVASGTSFMEDNFSTDRV